MWCVGGGSAGWGGRVRGARGLHVSSSYLSKWKQGSCLLHLLRKIYLYLQYDASNTARAQVTVYVGTKRGHEGGHQGPKWTSAYQFSTSSLAFDLTPHDTMYKCFFCTSNTNLWGINIQRFILSVNWGSLWTLGCFVHLSLCATAL